MRYRLLIICLAFLGSIAILNAQDFDATATAIVEGATQTAIAEANQPVAQSTPDQFALTATALIRAATQTAEAFTGETAAPVTANAQSDENFALTATALVEEATSQASGSFGTGEEPISEEEANAFAMSGTIVIFVIMLIGLGILGFVIVVYGRRIMGDK